MIEHQSHKFDSRSIEWGLDARNLAHVDFASDSVGDEGGAFFVELFEKGCFFGDEGIYLAGLAIEKLGDLSAKIDCW